MFRWLPLTRCESSWTRWKHTLLTLASSGILTKSSAKQLTFPARHSVIWMFLDFAKYCLFCISLFLFACPHRGFWFPCFRFVTLSYILATIHAQWFNEFSSTSVRNLSTEWDRGASIRTTIYSFLSCPLPEFQLRLSAVTMQWSRSYSSLTQSSNDGSVVRGLMTQADMEREIEAVRNLALNAHARNDELEQVLESHFQKTFVSYLCLCARTWCVSVSQLPASKWSFVFLFSQEFASRSDRHKIDMVRLRDDNDKLCGRIDSELSELHTFYQNEIQRLEMRHKLQGLWWIIIISRNESAWSEYVKKWHSCPPRHHSSISIL